MNLESSSNNSEQQNKDLNELLSELSQVKEQLANQETTTNQDAEEKIRQWETKTNKILANQEVNSEKISVWVKIEEIKKEVEIKEIYTHQDEKLAKLRERIIAAKNKNDWHQSVATELDPELYTINETYPGLWREQSTSQVVNLIQRPWFSFSASIGDKLLWRLNPDKIKDSTNT